MPAFVMSQTARSRQHWLRLTTKIRLPLPEALGATSNPFKQRCHEQNDVAG
jgi:hypothetical protein